MSMSLMEKYNSLWQGPEYRRDDIEDQYWPLSRGWRIAFAVIITLIFSNGWGTLLVGASEREEAISDASANLARSIFYFPYLLIILLLISKPIASLARLVLTPTIFAIILLIFCSSFWSIAPDITIRRSIALTATLLGAIALSVNLKWRDIILAYGITYAILIFFCYIYSIFIPTYGRMWILFPGAWRGVWYHKNTLGLEMAIGVVVLLNTAIQWPKYRWLWRAFALLALILIIMSRSKTALVSALLGISIMSMISMMRRGPIRFVIGGYIIVVGATILGSILYFVPDVFFHLLGKDATLTGRTSTWAAVVRQIHDKPILGFGFGAVWSNKDVWAPLAKISKEQGFVVGEAHNAWLQVTLDLGLVGFLVLLMFFMVLLFGISRKFFYKSTMLALPITVVFLMTSLTEANALSQNDWLWMLIVIFAAKVGQRTDRIELSDPALHWL